MSLFNKIKSIFNSSFDDVPDAQTIYFKNGDVYKRQDSEYLWMQTTQNPRSYSDLAIGAGIHRSFYTFIGKGKILS